MSPAGTAAESVGIPAPGHVRLLPLQPEPPANSVLNWLAAALREGVPARVDVEPPEPADEGWWTEERSQLSSNAIVDALIDRYPAAIDPPSKQWIVGLTAADLRGGEREYVFGEAALGGAWAVVSIARLGAQGEPEFRSRLLKETLHELGHLAGFEHCSDQDCLMAASPTVAAVDRKRPQLCRVCRSAAGPDGT